MITKKQLEVLNFIIGYIDKHTVSPSIREIVEGCGKSGTGTVHGMIDRLVERGFLYKMPNKHRGIGINYDMLKYIKR